MWDMAAMLAMNPMFMQMGAMNRTADWAMNNGGMNNGGMNNGAVNNGATNTGATNMERNNYNNQRVESRHQRMRDFPRGPSGGQPRGSASNRRPRGRKNPAVKKEDDFP
ncbi:hypothetical protein LQW54_005651 [Pestalotiopsis sp. IQ-011]